MQACESTLLVRPEHLNHHGFLFGGRLLEWLDEQAYIAAISSMKPEANLVTLAIDRVVFKYPAKQGALLRFRSTLVHVGNTSLTVHTQVFLHGVDSREIFSACVTFVCLDKQSKPCAVAPLMTTPFSYETLSSDAARELWRTVEHERKKRKS